VDQTRLPFFHGNSTSPMPDITTCENKNYHMCPYKQDYQTIPRIHILYHFLTSEIKDFEKIIKKLTPFLWDGKEHNI
jgi:hypothetical protein